MPRTGFTLNISESGVYVQTARPPKLGEVVSLGLVLRGGQQVTVRAVVARLDVPPPQFNRFVPSHFGARFLSNCLSLLELELSAPALERAG